LLPLEETPDVVSIGGLNHLPIKEGGLCTLHRTIKFRPVGVRP
jgi:hypothetical protein